MVQTTANGYAIPRPPVNTPLYNEYMHATEAFRQAEQRQKAAYAVALANQGFATLEADL